MPECRSRSSLPLLTSEEAMLGRAGHALQSATDWHRAHPAVVA
jgi:hypothetical protein